MNAFHTLAANLFSNSDHFLVVLLSCTVYLNSLSCGFVFDDTSAVKENQDLRPSTHWLALFANDFWGTPMSEERSHKSYRPLTVLTFRFNYVVHGLDPLGYHIVNVLLHCIVSSLFFRFCRRFLARDASFVSSLHFACHPIHTEAVTGVVGRAELLSAIFFLSIFFCYERFRLMVRKTDMVGMIVVCFLLAGGTLCKEQCITVVGVLLSLDLFDRHMESCDRLLSETYSDLSNQEHLGTSHKHSVFNSPISKCILRYIKAFFGAGNFTAPTILCIASAIILYGRGVIMDWKLPHFTQFDNPAAYATDLVRRFTHSYLIPLNLWLLIFPSGLCADWTLGSIKLIQDWIDHRNVVTVVTFALLFTVLLISLHPKTHRPSARTLFMSLCLMAFPFLPASNLFFPVGFVIAERVLYLCSLGFSLIFGLGYQNFSAFTKEKLKTIHSTKRKSFGIVTYDEYSLFRSALKVNPNNAKMWNNVGHSLEARGQFVEALGYFRKAVSVQPNDIGARINVGRTLANLNRSEDAEHAYFEALDYFPKPQKGRTYYTRVSPKDLTVFINLANLYMKKEPPRLEDAARLLRRAISLRSDFIDAYQNYGSVLVKQGKLSEAEHVYRTGVKMKNNNPDLLYNLGVVLIQTGKPSEAVDCFERALLMQPDHLPTMFALASALTDSKANPGYNRGKILFEKLLVSGYESANVHFSLGMLETDEENFEKSIEHYRQVIQLEPNHRSALFNLALLLRDHLRESDESRSILEHLLRVHPDHVKSYLLLGDILLSEKRDLESAKKHFLQALHLAPNNTLAKHNLCIILAEEGHLEESENCLLEVLEVTSDQNIVEHLRIVRSRRSAEPH